VDDSLCAQMHKMTNVLGMYMCIMCCNIFY